MKIARTTSDGSWTLTQTISPVPGTPPTAKIVMALTNNKSVSREAFLLRYADVDAETVVLNNFDATTNTALAWNSGTPQGHGTALGLVLQNLGSARSFGPFVQNTHNAPAPCDPFGNAVAGQQLSVDGSLVMLYDLVGIRKSSTATVTVGYKSW